MNMQNRLLFLELNEVNFEMVDAYASQGALPNFRRLFDTHGYCQTSSETDYENLEPWIQWVTAHTGLTLAEHSVFRLGDIVHHDALSHRAQHTDNSPSQVLSYYHSFITYK